ncbi:hypothetical protein HF521_016960 [Silurus meridionalis]|uniref:Uncharacterized protein n=1 Tax=Silurus meridionalis TaxID=175797 RepID=A0A8T0BNL2_SILME|nr:hypothetical protein HF521_016960 [Silurus meridionalis]
MELEERLSETHRECVINTKHIPYKTDRTISSDGEQVCFQLQSQTPVLLNRRSRDVHSSSSTATDETSTYRPLPPQTRRPLIVLYRHRRDVHSSSCTTTGRRPLIVLYRRSRDVHSSSSTAADEASTRRPLPPQTRRPLIVHYRRR